MISANLMGGLGNYMFQIGAASTLAFENNDLAIFNFNTQLQAHRDINEYKNNIFRNVYTTNDTVHIEAEFHEARDYSYNRIPYHANLYLRGYYQSDKYLNREHVLDLFKIDDTTLNIIQEKYSYIPFNNAVSVHVRRGNYLSRQNRHPVQSLDYYHKAFSNFNNATFVVFSNDINWCKENFKGDNFIFIDELEEDYISLYLMSLCKHNIIANSTFSWWGSYLGTDDRIVIAPSNWFGPALPLNTSNIYRSSWIVI